MEKLIVVLIILGFSAVQSMIKAANEKAKKEQRQAQGGARPRQRATVQNEIESFLEGINDPQPTAAPRQGSDSIRTRERRERRRQQAEAKKAEARNRQAAQKKAAREARKREADRKREAIGSGISRHVNEYISQHVDEYIDHDVEEYVEATIVESVEDNLGDRSEEMPPLTGQKPTRSAAADVARLLRNPEGVRNAILVNEILSRPRALRK
ncbi:MAG: hypothetical protein NXI04_17680 [Planctomycetaceae bacterium]|nr:hypothetical protein [Planctomycetaceae bacterium]